MGKDCPLPLIIFPPSYLHPTTTLPTKLTSSSSQTSAPWVGLWLIFWVITNVSTAFYDVDIEPGFYRWGYAWPLHHVVQAAKQILFDLHSQIGVNFAVLITWAVVNTLVFPFACWFMKWKKDRGVNEYWR